MAYNDQIGVEFDEIWSLGSKDAQESAIEKTITEALLADPYSRTVSVGEFEHLWEGDAVTTSFTVTGQDSQELRFKKSIEKGNAY